MEPLRSALVGLGMTCTGEGLHFGGGNLGHQGWTRHSRDLECLSEFLRVDPASFQNSLGGRKWCVEGRVKEFSKSGALSRPSKWRVGSVPVDSDLRHAGGVSAIFGQSHELFHFAICPQKFVENDPKSAPKSVPFFAPKFAPLYFHFHPVFSTLFGFPPFLGFQIAPI